MGRIPISRRAFMAGSAAAGGGLLLGFELWRRRRGPALAPFDAHIRIGPDDAITLLIDETEMGQGVLTALPMILAEELHADWARVRAEHAPCDPARYGSQWTSSSTSVRRGYERLRQAGAAARAMLVRAAADDWGVTPESCRTEPSVVVHAASGRRAGYGALATRAAALPVPDAPPLRAERDFRLIGTSTPRLDVPDKVTGRARFGIDVRVPDMLVAQVAHPLVFGGTLASADEAAARATPGVRDVVRLPDGIAVVADHFWAARAGRAALAPTWAAGEAGLLEGDAIRKRLADAVGSGRRYRAQGDVAAALAGAAHQLEAVYEAPYQAHAPMEPLNATAHVQGDRCTLWVPTQFPSDTRDAAAAVLGIAPERVEVNVTMLGGGFGRRGAVDFVRDAVRVAAAVGRPVQVVWTREDDVRGGQYRPASYHRLRGAVDAEGWPCAWQHHLATPTPEDHIQGADDVPYAFAAIDVRAAHAPVPITTRPWRSVAHSFNAWAAECFFDELARAGGVEPLQARRRLLAHAPRLRAVLDAAAARADWGARLPAGRARGVALHACFGSFAAQVAEVELMPGGTPRIVRVVCAVDCGRVVNPDIVAAQVEGGIAWGLSAALFGAIDIEAGRTRQANFHDFRVLRLHEMPAVETVLVASDAAPGGVGEISTPPLAPAVCNALLALTGRPVRTLPIDRALGS